MATALNATMTWIPFFPGATELSGSLQWIGVAWVFGIVAVLGWWAGRSGGWWPAVEVAVALIIAGGAPALFFGLAPPPSWAWVTALVAGVLGGTFGRRLAGAALHPAVSGLP